MFIIYSNKKVHFDYEVTKTRSAGIVLLWHEVKALKTKQASINEAIIKNQNNRLYITWMQIQLYDKANIVQIGAYNPTRSRELLFNKHELQKIVPLITKTGHVLVLQNIFIAKNKRLKATIWLAVRKKKFEKKQLLKERDIDKQSQRDIKNIWL